MPVTILRLTARDPIIARDGRPFGAGQGNRMRGLNWPLPSVVAGSLRTALVKANPNLDFSGYMPRQLLDVDVAGVFPAVEDEVYLPAPSDCLWDEYTNMVHRAQPIAFAAGEGVDFSMGGLLPVRLTEKQAPEDFKAKEPPAWWPRSQYEKWLTDGKIEYGPEWFTRDFLREAKTEIREHVSLDPYRGAAAESQLFATVGLNVSYLPRHDVEGAKSFWDRFANSTLTARITTENAAFAHLEQLDTWHPLGGERRLVHWQRSDAANLWTCPDIVKSALVAAKHTRMVVATPAIFAGGWKPGWVNDQLEGTPPGTSIKLKLVGVSNGRWRAVSGWSLAKINNEGKLDQHGKPGPKPIRRMVPAGSVYFFEAKPGEAAALSELWLHSVSDDEQERRDGFGLAVWGVW